MRVVIVGAGVAGTTAAEELKKLDPSVEVVLISEEVNPLYSRVLLPHYLKGKIPRERVFLKKESWYVEAGIEWIEGVLVTALDPKNRFVALSDGREVPYDRLILATGGNVRHLPFDVRGVSYLRTLEDADHLVQLLNEVPEGAPVVVYGGGFIACEYINLFALRTLPTTVCLRGKQFFSGSLSGEVSERIAQHLVQGGVRILPNTSIHEAVGEKELTGVQTSQGELPAHILGVGVGIELDRSWLEKSGIEVRGGIVTNEFFETNIEGIYAIGDAAEFYDPIVGRPLQVGNWLSAMTHARTVAKTIAGAKTAIQLVSSYATNALGLELIFIGDVSREAADEVVVRRSAEDGGVAELFVRGDRLVGAALVGKNTDRAQATKWIQSKMSIRDRLESWKDGAKPLE